MSTKVWKLSEGRQCLSFALRKAARSVTRRYDRALRPMGLRSTQFNLLVVLDATGAITTTALARTTAIERSTLTRNLALIASKGWVRSAPGDNRRSRKVSLTGSGRRAALKALPAWRRVQAELRKELGSKEFAALSARLGGLTDV
jgi:DNA-binding MarR family transcriptional regulator